MEDFDINFDYEPLTEEEAMRARYSLLEDGFYDALVNKVTAKISGSGNPMAEVTLSVFDKEGKPTTVTDFLVFTSKMIWKIKHAADSAGLSKEFEEKKFKPQMLAGKNVKVEIKTQVGSEIPVDKLRGKPEGSCYPDKNVVNDYVMTDKGAVKHAKASNSDETFDDVIPF